MKKKIVTLTAIAALSVGIAGQVSAESYTVQPGDTLWSISQAKNISVEQVKGQNDLSSNLIFPQQQLEIDSEKPAAVSEEKATYTVASGDTLFKIAKAHNLSLDTLMSWNGITGHWIFPGDKLVVKGGTPISVPKAPKEEAPAQAPAQSTAKASAKAAAPVQAAASVQSGKEMTVSATAYTAFCAGCSGVTATGQDLRSNPNQKVIAVDPTVIPLGSKVWVEGYGTAIAGDTGGAIKGNKIDVFIPSQGAALDWGRKTITIKILD